MGPGVRSSRRTRSTTLSASSRSTADTSRASWWRRRKARNKSLSQRISSRQEKRLRPKMGLFLVSQENATCDNISFGKQAPTSINNQLLGQSQKSPQEILCIKNVSESEPINETSRAS